MNLTFVGAMGRMPNGLRCCVWCILMYSKVKGWIQTNGKGMRLG